MPSTSGFRLTLIASAIAAAPAVVLAAPLTPARVFVDAAPPIKLIMLALVVSILAAVVICARKLMAGPALVGGSAFLSNLRLGGPLLGALGGFWTLLYAAIGLSNVPETPSMQVLAPGFAEVVLQFVLGFCAGAVAAICHWAVEARIDKAVLKV